MGLEVGGNYRQGSVGTMMDSAQRRSTMTRALQVLSVALCWAAATSFVLQPPMQSRTCRLASSSSTSLAASLVVVSPPGGVGEVAAVQAASMGAEVRWFVVSQASTSPVTLAQQALDTIAKQGGKIELAGVDAKSLLLPADDASSAIGAVAVWCGAPDAILATADGVRLDRKLKGGEDDPRVAWKNAIKVAAAEAAKAVKGKKIAILAADEDDEATSEEKEGLGSFVGGLFGGKVSVPSTLTSALSPDGAKVYKLRHGELFGIPESSPDFSPLVGGPRKMPELCEEYQMRAVRVDPTLSLSGNLMMGSSTRSSRHAVGQAAALMALDKVPMQAALDVCVSSLRGSDELDEEVWQQEFRRVAKMLEDGPVAQLFAAEMESVPDIERLADWLSTKWAPAVLRTYDIATIRAGARPVYATRAGEGIVEIVWQQLVDFQSVTVGKMIIEVTDSAIVARRGPGDASKGFGAITRKPLAGEDVLVRLLAEAASQAVEKGLATKAKSFKKPKEVPKPVEPAPVVTTIQASGTVETADAEPRKSPARRSKERSRGKRRNKSESS